MEMLSKNQEPAYEFLGLSALGSSLQIRLGRMTFHNRRIVQSSEYQPFDVLELSWQDHQDRPISLIPAE